MSQRTPDPVESPVAPASEQMASSSFHTRLALDRTTLAWLRTTLTMGSFGFGMVGYFRSLQEQAKSEQTARLYAGAIRMGTALFLLATVATVLASVQHWYTLRRLKRGQSPVLTLWPLSITVALLFAGSCLFGVWALFER